jgi:integrase/recombinase XerD
MRAALELSSKKNREGLYEIFIRLQDGNHRRRIKTNYAVHKTQFKSQDRQQRWVRNHDLSHSINAELKRILETFNVQIAQDLNKGIVPSPESVIFKLTKSEGTTSLIQFLQEKTDLMINYNHRKGYQQALNNWLDFVKTEKLGDLDFREVTVNVLKRFENYLFKKGLQSSTVYANLKRIRAAFNMAIKEQVITPGDYIFRAYKMPSAKSANKKEKLTAEELKLFLSQSYPDGSGLKAAQQAFFLAFCMAGVRIEDVLTLTWTDIKNDRIEYKMEKTGSLSSFQITPQIKAVLDYFRQVNLDSPTVTGFLPKELLELKDSRVIEENERYKKAISSKTALVNKYLNQIAEDACLGKKVSTHIARHTFATIAAKKTNGNIQFVQNALKHSNAKITQAYLASLDLESLDDTMAEVTNL